MDNLVFESRLTRFWRIQNSKTGVGPITRAVKWYPFQYHWCPTSFFGYRGREVERINAMFDEGWRCGWRRRHLMENFPDSRKTVEALETDGFKVFVLEATNCLHLPDGQVMFDPRVVREIEAHSPRVFFKEFDEINARRVFGELDLQLSQRGDVPRS